jgi:RES domain-containing protein
MRAPEELADALAALFPVPFAGTLYRAIHLEALYGFHQPVPYPEPRPLYSLGAPRAGARYTPRGGMPTLYMAEDAETAFAEANQVAAALQALDPSLSPPKPTVIVSARARLMSVLDLTDPAIRAALGTDETELVAPWRLRQDEGGMAPTQRLGQAAFDSGRFQALRYPSRQLSGRRCLAIFPDRLAGGAFVEIHDPDGNVYQRLP